MEGALCDHNWSSDARKLKQMRRSVSGLIVLAIGISLPGLNNCQPASGEDVNRRLSGVNVIASEKNEGEPLLRGLESDTFSNTSTKPSGTEESKPEAAPGADAVMTEDLLMVDPAQKPSAPQPAPLKAFVGQSLTITVERSDICLEKLQGVMVSVVNETSRPLVLDGDNAEAIGDGANYKCAPLLTIQRSVLPDRSGKAMAKGFFTKVLPAAATVGLVPTIEDISTMKKPIRLRYGPDELRRLAEASRFGSRILWPHQKTNGIVYFDSAQNLTGTKITIPVQTLFDASDKSVLSATL
ncbi:MAG: hypothetical protein C5B53_09530 [Candidatus Melainabacteria bacterium]|nr:MAG: hypothetical protein C5B53_09530 [Candidatus Melainabacteria bacterium]